MIMKAISIPKNKYEAEEERLAKLNLNRIIGIRSVESVARGKQADIELQVRNVESEACSGIPLQASEALSLTSLKVSTAKRLEDSSEALSPQSLAINAARSDNDDSASVWGTASRRQPSKRYSEAQCLWLKCQVETYYATRFLIFVVLFLIISSHFCSLQSCHRPSFSLSLSHLSLFLLFYHPYFYRHPFTSFPCYLHLLELIFQYIRPLFCIIPSAATSCTSHLISLFFNLMYYLGPPPEQSATLRSRPTRMKVREEEKEVHQSQNQRNSMMTLLIMATVTKKRITVMRMMMHQLHYLLMMKLSRM